MMDYWPEIDTPLDFRQYVPRETIIRDTLIIGGRVAPDAVTSYASQVRHQKEKFGEFGQGGGGQAAKKHSKGLRESLHHQQYYAPVYDATEEYINEH